MAGPTTLARPYARAAFEVAREQGALSEWEAALQAAAGLATHPELLPLLGHPAVSGEDAVGLVQPAGKLPGGFENFLRLLEVNDRLSLLAYVASQFSELKDLAEQTVAVSIDAATEVNPDQRERLEKALAARFTQKIELTVSQNADLIGGAVVRAGDLVIDGSVRGKLERMRAALAG